MSGNESLAFAGRKTLVTGAAGFVGQHLCRAILEHGGQVAALERSADAAFPEGAIPVVCDIQDAEGVRAAMVKHRPDFVYHLAAYVSAEPNAALLLPTLQVNLNGSVHILAALHETGCHRVIVTGSSEEGEPDDVPASPYGVAKACTRLYAAYFARHLGLPVTYFRLNMAYGPGQSRAKLIPYLITSLLRREPPLVKNPGRRYDPVYIDDVIRALLQAGSSAGLEGSVLEARSAATISIREIALLLQELTGSEASPVFGHAPPNEEIKSPVSSNHAAAPAAWTWRPRIDLAEGLSATVDWYRKECQP